MESTKKCPFCGEEIKAEAMKCRFCGQWLNEDTVTAASSQPSTPPAPPVPPVPPTPPTPPAPPVPPAPEHPQHAAPIPPVPPTPQPQQAPQPEPVQQPAPQQQPTLNAYPQATYDMARQIRAQQDNMTKAGSQGLSNALPGLIAAGCMALIIFILLLLVKLFNHGYDYQTIVVGMPSMLCLGAAAVAMMNIARGTSLNPKYAEAKTQTAGSYKMTAVVVQLILYVVFFIIHYLLYLLGRSVVELYIILGVAVFGAYITLSTTIGKALKHQK